MLILLIYLFLNFFPFWINSLFLVCCFPFWMAYSIGMAEYSRNNNYGDRETEKKRVWSNMINEKEELEKEIKHFKFVGILMESNDLIHILIKYLLVCYFPIKVGKINITINSPFIWFFLFLIAPPLASFKHSRRYILNGCIRNHKNSSNLDHYCDFRKF